MTIPSLTARTAFALVDAQFMADEVVSGPHLFEMEVAHGDRPECTGTECRLAQVSVL